MPDAGDVVVAEFPGAMGTKRRPAVVLSSELYHASRPDLILGLITSRTAAAIAPTDYALEDWEEANLRVASAFRSFISTTPKVQVSRTVGKLSARDWAAIKNRVRRALTDLGDS